MKKLIASALCAAMALWACSTPYWAAGKAR